MNNSWPKAFIPRQNAALLNRIGLPLITAPRLPDLKECYEYNIAPFDFALLKLLFHQFK